MKDKGNLIFRQGNFSLASSLYKQALNFLCYIGLLPSSDHQAFSSLALSLVLNLAACELKISHFDLASRYCKFVLHFDPSNVKALYCRGLAYKKLNLLKDAQADFEQVLKLDLNNSEAKRELLDVTDQLTVNLNGKRTAYSFDPLGSIFKGKKPLLHKGVVDYTDEASCSPLL
ncbi:peptidyl-prolyl cis-trans isomerase FKBP62-like [Silene latifolia]|uniref:peptidyl-prolyl cis-trans isomerase FKBP62-like n=1 Tax=Silene latifolia TaxID=37657 RepID=UPI003D77D15A